MTLKAIYFIDQTIGTSGGRAWFGMFGDTMHPKFEANMEISRSVTKEDWMGALNALGKGDVK